MADELFQFLRKYPLGMFDSDCTSLLSCCLDGDAVVSASPEIYRFIMKFLGLVFTQKKQSDCNPMIVEGSIAHARV